MKELSSSLSALNATVERLGNGLDHLEGTLSSLDDLAKRLIVLVQPVEAIVERLDYMVSVGETVMSPLSVTEHACAGWWTSCGTEWCGSSCPIRFQSAACAWNRSALGCPRRRRRRRDRRGPRATWRHIRRGKRAGPLPVHVLAHGIESFYALTEETASKAVADYMMLRRKLPDEIFAGRRILPNALFRRDDVAAYLTTWTGARAHRHRAGAGRFGGRLRFDARLGHRMGLASWADPDRPKVQPSSVWCAHSTSWMARTRSFTPTGWRRWRRRTTGRTGCAGRGCRHHRRRGGPTRRR